MIGWILTIIACILFLKCWNKVSGDDKKIKNLKSNLKKNFKMKNENDMTIEISNDFYNKDYDDVSIQEIETSEDDSDVEAAEQFGY